MAVYNEIQVGRYVRFLQKFLSIKGRQPAPLQFSGELNAVWALFHGVENRYLESWYRYGAFLLPGALAAANSGVRLRNPTASNVIAVVEVANASEGAADLMFLNIGPATTDLTTVSNPAKLDSRIKTNSSALVLSSGNTVPSLGTNINAKSIPANGAADFILFEEQEIVLNPGDALQMVTNSVNVAANFTFNWRERPTEESERT